jgi:hypothetical protein
MKYPNLISGLFWLALGLLLSIWSLSYPIGGVSQPGPGFSPLASGILLILFSLVLLARARKPSPTEKEGPSTYSPGGWKKVVYIVLILLLTTFLFEKMGYLLTIFLLVFLSLSAGDFKSWKKIFLITLFTLLGFYVLFVRLLEQPFPRGLLGI